MSKKVKADRVRIGMYIESVDRPWLETSFPFQGFPIEKPEDIVRIRHSCDFVYVADENEKKKHTNNKLAPLSSNQNAFFSGLNQAKRVRDQSKTLVDIMHEDVNSGQNIDAEGAKNLINEMVPTMAQNLDAMVWMTNLKHKDQYTAIHSINVCILSMAFGHHLGIQGEALVTLGLGALLHDIGKLHIPLDILNKPGKLTATEYKIIQQHPINGRRIIQNTEGLAAKIDEVAFSHHEKFAGGGYPNGRKLDKIGDLFPQIVAIVDTYDALASDRCYRKGLAPTEVIKIIFEGRGLHFHPNLVDEFSTFIGVEPIGSLVELNTGEVGITLFSVADDHAKPVVLLILDSNKKKYYPLRVVDFNLLKGAQDTYFIKDLLPPGSHGININDYVNDILFTN